eukprot:74131_1
MGGCCGAHSYEIPVMKTHDSCNRSYRYCDILRKNDSIHKYSNNSKYILPTIDTRSIDSHSVTSISSRLDDIELNTNIIISYILLLNESDLMNGWNSIDKKFDDKISLTNDVGKLLSYFIAEYINSKEPEIERNVDGRQYSLKVGKIISEIKNALQSVLLNNGINVNEMEFVTQQWFIENFQQYMEQINSNNVSLKPV